jgi:hypothetical protein
MREQGLKIPDLQYIWNLFWVTNIRKALCPLRLSPMFPLSWERTPDDAKQMSADVQQRDRIPLRTLAFRVAQE